MRRNPNYTARARGSRAESLLLRQLEDKGYDVRRTHLSAFPDIIAWNDSDLLLIEVKSRAGAGKGVSNALSLFRASFRTLRSIPNHAKVLCYVRVNNAWTAYQYLDGETRIVESIVTEERSCQGN
jgi:Holliday junction resolvase-like predicted endonuclease